MELWGLPEYCMKVSILVAPNRRSNVLNGFISASVFAPSVLTHFSGREDEEATSSLWIYTR